MIAGDQLRVAASSGQQPESAGFEAGTRLARTLAIADWLTRLRLSMDGKLA